MAKVFGIDISTLTLDQTIDSLLKLFHERDMGTLVKPFHVVTVNAEFLQKAEKDPFCKQLIQKADLRTADGIGTVKAVEIVNGEKIERVTGIDLMTGLLEKAPKGTTAFLLGAQPEVIEKAAANIQKKYPNIEVIGYLDGFFDKNQADEIAGQIGLLAPDLLFVGMGFPYQDWFLEEYKNRLRYLIGVGVGGSFDVLSGMIQRAPEAIQKMGMEWLYRTVKDPKRAKRLAEMPKFIAHVYGQKGKGKENPSENE